MLAGGFRRAILRTPGPGETERTFNDFDETFHSSVLRGNSGGIAACACLFALSAQAQVCNVQPSFPDATVTSAMDRDRIARGVPGELIGR
jgi:hypothetical protein